MGTSTERPPWERWQGAAQSYSHLAKVAQDVVYGGTLFSGKWAGGRADEGQATAASDHADAGTPWEARIAQILALRIAGSSGSLGSEEMK